MKTDVDFKLEKDLSSELLHMDKTYDFVIRPLNPINPILDGGEIYPPPPSWFFEYSSETVRSRKLKLCDF